MPGAKPPAKSAKAKPGKAKLAATKSATKPSGSFAHARGRFVWHDLLTTDPAAAIAFYTKLIGWGTEEWNGAMPYTMWKTKSKTIGGIMPLPAEAAAMGGRPHWLAYIGTPDVDATVAQAAKLGAKVMRPGTDIPTVGRFAVLADPDGALFAPFMAVNPPPDSADSDAAPKVQEFSWHELTTRDYKKAFNFYHTLFGWDKMDAHDMGPLGIYQLFGLGGRPVGGMFNAPPGTPTPPQWLHYIRVESVDKSAPRVTQLGGRINHGPMEVPGGDRIVMCADPHGAPFALHSTKT